MHSEGVCYRRDPISCADGRIHPNRLRPSLAGLFESAAMDLAEDAGWELVAFVGIHPPIL